MRLILAALVCLFALSVDATPEYAARAGHACNSCHIEPSGWENAPESSRRCALHCSSCHVSPAGGGLRTPAGLFFGRDQLSIWASPFDSGERPSSNAAPERYRPAGHPKEGRYRLGEGFSGWWPGEIPVRAIPDRYGDIVAEPFVSLGADIRWMTIIPLDDKRRFATFPMQFDLYGALRPFENFVIAGSGGFRARERDVFAQPDFSDFITVREVYAMVDRLPYGLYVRGGRFPVSYGWRFPDHTTFSRRALDLARPQNRQVLGVEVGAQSNYFFAHASAFAEGTEWPGDEAPPGTGAALSVGIRDLGFQLAANLATTQATDPMQTDRWLGGLSFSANLYPVVYLAQLDAVVQRPSSPRFSDIPLEVGFVAHHEVIWQMIRGVSVKAQYDWIDDHLQLKDNHLHRLTLGTKLDIIPGLQTELLYRQHYRAERFDAHELLSIIHVWF